MERIYKSIGDFLKIAQNCKIVFIGGDFDHLALLTHILEIIKDLEIYRSLNLYPIVAYQINIPFMEIYRQDMILLSKSDFAIFEITSPAGQLLELERAKRLIEEGKDLKMGIYFQIRDSKLALLDDVLQEEKTPGQISSMITGFIDLYEKGKVDIQGYENLEQLRRIISILLGK